MEPESSKTPITGTSLYSQMVLPAGPPISVASTLCRKLLFDQLEQQRQHNALVSVVELHARALIEKLQAQDIDPLQVIKSLTEESSAAQISPEQVIESALKLPEGSSCQQMLQRLSFSQSAVAANTAILILSNKASFEAQKKLGETKAIVSQLSAEELSTMLLKAAEKDRSLRFSDHNLFGPFTIRSLVDSQPPDALIRVFEELHLQRQQLLDTNANSVLSKQDQIWAPALAWAHLLTCQKDQVPQKIAELYQFGDISTTRTAIFTAAIERGIDLSKIFKQEIERPSGAERPIERGVQGLKHLVLSSKAASFDFVTSMLTSPVPQYAFYAVHLLCHEELFGAAGRETVVNTAWSLLESNQKNPVLSTLLWSAGSERESNSFFPTQKALVEFLSRKPLSKSELIKNLSGTSLHLPRDAGSFSDILKNDPTYLRFEDLSIGNLLGGYFPVSVALSLSAQGGILGRNAETIFEIQCEQIPNHTTYQVEQILNFPTVYRLPYQSILRIGGMPSTSSEATK